ncbi:MAG TPA: tetratricopeptide repeat protein [Gemmatimonadaceae bacterium]|nr:tetratricopeptide repeat protein [Gemmatimonadaceae bacterium]
MRSFLHAVRVLLGASMLAGTAVPAAAQQLAPKRTLAAGGPTGCAAFPFTASPPSSSAPADDAETLRLIDQGQEAAVQGEHAAARDAFARAAELAPANARVAYYLGREHEALRDRAAAVREYCRYLALAPNAPDAGDVRGRIARIVPAAELSRVDAARAGFRSGLTLLERRQFQSADSVFGAVAGELPFAPEVFYNRGLARAARGERRGALQDLEQYLTLSPTATDRAAVVSAMARLQERSYSPGQAFASGLIVPGMGQMATGRPAVGVAVLAAVAGAVAAAFMSEDVRDSVRFVDPNGQPYYSPVTRTEYPYREVGLGVAAGLWIAGAFEARNYAGRSQNRVQDILLLPGAATTGSAARGAPDVRRAPPVARLTMREATVAPFVARGVRQGFAVGLSVALGRR